ncbi:hypothetical protein C8F01DRAFT_1120965 [Mycena amicta]|nr:hypothetical protein C8F01DRAFT_1120965 [Mycena amicta]
MLRWWRRLPRLDAVVEGTIYSHTGGKKNMPKFGPKIWEHHCAALEASVGTGECRSDVQAVTMEEGARIQEVLLPPHGVPCWVEDFAANSDQSGVNLGMEIVRIECLEPRRCAGCHILRRLEQVLHHFRYIRRARIRNTNTGCGSLLGPCLDQVFCAHDLNIVFCMWYSRTRLGMSIHVQFSSPGTFLCNGSRRVRSVDRLQARVALEVRLKRHRINERVVHAVFLDLVVPTVARIVMWLIIGKITLSLIENMTQTYHEAVVMVSIDITELRTTIRYLRDGLPKMRSPSYLGMRQQTFRNSVSHLLRSTLWRDDSGPRACLLGWDLHFFAKTQVNEQDLARFVDDDGREDDGVFGGQLIYDLLSYVQIVGVLHSRLPIAKGMGTQEHVRLHEHRIPMVS